MAKNTPHTIEAKALCVIVVHETPNAHPESFELADQTGRFQVWVPSLWKGQCEAIPPIRSALLSRSCIWNAISFSQ